MNSADAELIAAEITVLTVRAKRQRAAVEKVEARIEGKQMALDEYEAENVA